MSEFSGYIACIAEGNSERAILDILLENHCLIFEYEQLIEEKVLNCRKASVFENRYLGKRFDSEITVYRILDSRRERFALSKAYTHKISVINVITAPEIEMLIIINESKYKEFNKSGKKPSEFCKGDLGFTRVKSYEFVKKYFSDYSNLISAIKEYKRLSQIKRGEVTLYDLLKENLR